MSTNNRPKVGRRVWIWRRYRSPAGCGGRTGFWESCCVENAGREVSGVRSRYGYLLQVPNTELYDHPGPTPT